MAKVKCSNCGEIGNENWMVKYNTGRSGQWLCWACYLKGQHEVGINEARRSLSISKEMKGKKK
jgi:hypothetical protein